MSEEKERSNPVPIMVSQLIIGIILLVTLCANSHLKVSDTWSVAMNTRPNSLLCNFQSVEFSKETTTSNITGESFVLLTIFYRKPENFTAYTERKSDTIQYLGYITWKDGEMYAILPREVPDGSYVIGTGDVDYFGSYKTTKQFRFLIVEEIHEPNTLERIVIEYPYLAQTLLITLLTLAFSLILLPVTRLVEYFE